MEHVDGLERRRVELGIVLHGPELAGANQPLPVEREPPAAGQLAKGVGLEVAPPERPGMHPAGIVDRSAEPGLHVVQGPGRPERLDPDLAAIAVVRQVEDGRHRLRPPDDRKPDRVERPEQGAILLGAAGHDQARLAERPEGPCREERHAARPRRPSVDEVARGVADDGDEAHDATSLARS